MLIKNKTKLIKILGVTDLTLLAFASTKDIILTLKTQKSIMAFSNFLGKSFLPMSGLTNFMVYSLIVLGLIAICLEQYNKSKSKKLAKR